MEKRKYIYRGSVDELRAEMECLRDDNPEGWQASGGARVSWREWPPPRVSTRATWIVGGAVGHAVMDAYQKKPRQTEVVLRDGCDLAPITYRKRPAEPMGPASEEFTQMLAKELKLTSIEDGFRELGVLRDEIPAEEGAGEDNIRVPQRLKDLTRWRATWGKVKAEWRKARSYEAISEWLGKMHPDLACSPETLADIVRAGEAGRLD